MRKRILTIQDYSCMGRCSLTVALPTISSLGIEAVGIPTAVLSNHTQFKAYTYKDLSEEILPIVSHWDDYDHHFDCIYTGYLGNDQVPLIIKVIEKLKAKGTFVYVDPAMADEGELYPGFDQSHVEAMRELLKYADYLKPNLTEACLLCDLPYPEHGKSSISFFEEAARRLSLLGPKKIIISGARFEEGKTGAYCYDAEKGESSYFQEELLPGRYHGTGDLFSSALSGELTLGVPLLEAARLAHHFVASAIKETLKNHTDGLIYGPDFESSLEGLAFSSRKALELLGITDA